MAGVTDTLVKLTKLAQSRVDYQTEVETLKEKVLHGLRYAIFLFNIFFFFFLIAMHTYIFSYFFYMYIYTLFFTW